MDNIDIESSAKGILEDLERSSYTTDLEKTAQLGLKAYSLCAEINNEKGMAYALLKLGQSFFDMNQYDKAITYLFDSIALSQKQNICDLQVLSYLNIGKIYFDIGNYEKSYEFYRLAEKVVQAYQLCKNYYANYSYEYFIVKIYNNVADIFKVQRLYPEAIKYYNLAREFDAKLNYQASQGSVLSNLANIESYFGNFEQALSHIQEALIYLEKYKYKQGLCEAYGELAIIYQKMFNTVACAKYFDIAIQLSSEIMYGYVKVKLLLKYADFLISTPKTKCAIQKLEEAYRISLENKLYKLTTIICKKLIQLFEEEADDVNANKYYKLYFEYERLLEPIEFNTKIKNFKTKIQLEQLEIDKKNILEKSIQIQRKTNELIEVIKNISIISEIGEKVTATLELNQIYEMMNYEIQNFFMAKVFGIALFDESSGMIEYQYCMETNKRIEMNRISINSNSSLAAKCLQDRKTIIINDLPNEYINYIENKNYLLKNNSSYELNSVMFCPLIIDNNILGLLTVQAEEKNFFTMITIEVVKALTSYVAIAINNAIKSTVLLEEIEKRRELQKKLENSNTQLLYLSENDDLTHLGNRRKLNAIIEEELKRAKEKKSLLSIMMFDVDYFKQYNDNYGHISGDNCLIKISNEIKKILTKNTFAARYGGDEFVVVLPGLDLSEAIAFGERLRKNVEALGITHQFSENIKVVTITTGIYSLIPVDSITVTELLEHADSALYKAKNGGKNSIVGNEKSRTV
ncbi:MAG: diguanylate cyclase domain-containing protein [Lachnotalea sp.]